MATDYEKEALALVEKWVRDGSAGAKELPRSKRVNGAKWALWIASGPVAAALRGARDEGRNSATRVISEYETIWRLGLGDSAEIMAGAARKILDAAKET